MECTELRHRHGVHTLIRLKGDRLDLRGLRAVATRSAYLLVPSRRWMGSDETLGLRHVLARRRYRPAVGALRDLVARRDAQAHMTPLAPEVAVSGAFLLACAIMPSSFKSWGVSCKSLHRSTVPGLQRRRSGFRSGRVALRDREQRDSRAGDDDLKTWSMRVSTFIMALKPASSATDAADYEARG